MLFYFNQQNKLDPVTLHLIAAINSSFTFSLMIKINNAVSLLWIIYRNSFISDHCKELTLKTPFINVNNYMPVDNNYMMVDNLKK